MKEELSALQKINTWDLVPLRSGKSTIGSRWVYKIKTKSDGSVERYKARLVAKGFSQQYGYLLSQSKYIADILERACLIDTRTVDTPCEHNVQYSPSDGNPLSDPTLYRTIVGNLVYLTITRPDIAYVIHIFSQFVASPTTIHWAAILRILRYLRGTIFHSLLLPSTSSLDLRAYSDADHGRDPTSRKFVTGFCIFLGDSLISWKSKKQTVVSQSSTEVEYHAMASTTKEIVWLRWLLVDMGVSLSHPTPMYCDKKSAI
ncbi:hypothetical protein UlMin_027817 [Ulmus minor]